MAEIHHGIAFARHYVAGTGRGHFNVATAFDRLKQMQDDLAFLDRALERADKAAQAEEEDEAANDQHPWRGYKNLEIISYYAVGLVTCLEWHARSRLTDLFTFRPECISAIDLKPLANASLMQQMVANDVSAAQLLGALNNVSTIEKYAAIFERVYQELGITSSPFGIIEDVADAPSLLAELSLGGMENMAQLFSFRNNLVHEVGFNVTGAYSMRDALTLDSASRWVDVTIRLMLAVEAPITASGPSDFPNCILQNGEPRNDDQIVQDTITDLEQKIAKSLADKGRDHGDWSSAVEASRSAMDAEHAFLFSGSLSIRMFENVTPSRQALRAGRLAYLKSVWRAIDTLPG